MGVHWGWLSCGVEVEVPGQGVLGDGKEEINSNSKVSSACAFDLGVQEGPSHGPSATRWSLAGSPEFSSSCPAAVTGIPGICLPCFQEVISSWWLQSFREGAHPDLVLRPKSACRVKGARKPPRFLRCSQHQGGP